MEPYGAGSASEFLRSSMGLLGRSGRLGGGKVFALVDRQGPWTRSRV